jgi:site-specific recombinase XerD
VQVGNDDPHVERKKAARALARTLTLHEVVDHGISPVSLNAAITGLKFFFDVTADHPELMAKMQPVHVPHTLPVVLSREEVARLIAAAITTFHLFRGKRCAMSPSASPVVRETAWMGWWCRPIRCWLY